MSAEEADASSRAEVATGSDIAWTIRISDTESAPKSFPTLAIQLRNRGASIASTSFEIAAAKPLQSLSARQVSVELAPGEEKTLLHTLYVPPDAPGASAPVVTVRQANGPIRETTIRIKSAAAFKAKTVEGDSRFIRSGEQASYKIRIENTGNTPLHFAFAPKTSPEKSQTKATPETLLVPAGVTGEAIVEMQAPADVAVYTAFVTSLDIVADELPDTAARECLYFHTEVFPPQTPPKRMALYEALKGSIQIGIGSTNGPRRGRGASEAFTESLAVEGLVGEQTRLQFLQSFTHPSERRGELSSALSSLPGTSQRNFFHFGLYNPHWDLELGEVSAVSARLLSPRETGDGVRAAMRPLSRPESLQVEIFTERNTLTLNRKDVFGAALSGSPASGPLEFWRVASLSKRRDRGPQGRDWDSVALESGWKIPLKIPLRAELSAAVGRNHEGQSGAAWQAALHHNRTLPGEKDESPLKAGVEYAVGGKGFPGTQNGREDRRGYASYRFREDPAYLEAYASYNESIYKVVPNIERTLVEEQDVLPEFLRTSQSRLVNVGLRWKTFKPDAGAWHLPSGNFELQQTRYFNRSNFFDQADEKAAALNLTLLDQAQPDTGGATWHLNLASRGGLEMHEDGSSGRTDSSFLTVGPNLTYGRPAPNFLEKLAGPGVLGLEFSARYTHNFDADRSALNRTGVSANASATWQTDGWSLKAASALYSYDNAGVSSRTSASIDRRIGRSWWAGVQAALTTRQSTGTRGNSANEGAVMLTFRPDFSVPVPWMPQRGQSTGRVFEDLNNNGRADAGELGIAGVKVAAGKGQALTDDNGSFTLPSTESGSYPLKITPPADVHYNESAARKVEQVQIVKGEITNLAVGLIKPTTCEGQVRFARTENADAELLKAINHATSEELAGFEITATDATGKEYRGFTRADGFFALYLEPGEYQLAIDRSTLRAQHTVTPERVTIKIAQERIEGLEFTVADQPKKIRKTFTAQNP